MTVDVLFRGVQVPWSVVFTKVDSMIPGQPPVEANVQTFLHACASALKYKPPHVSTSGATGSGREELLRYISQLRKAFKMPLSLSGTPVE